MPDWAQWLVVLVGVVFSVWWSYRETRRETLEALERKLLDKADELRADGFWVRIEISPITNAPVTVDYRDAAPGEPATREGTYCHDPDEPVENDLRHLSWTPFPSHGEWSLTFIRDPDPA